VSIPFTSLTLQVTSKMVAKKLSPQAQNDELHNALARFRQAGSSSYLVIEWKIDAKIPPASSAAYYEAVKKSNNKIIRAKTKPTVAPTIPQVIKTTHIYAAEGSLFAFNLQALERWLLPGSHYHVLLQAQSDVVLIQQLAGASV
jgi:hypothetical protein